MTFASQVIFLLEFISLKVNKFLLMNILVRETEVGENWKQRRKDRGRREGVRGRETEGDLSMMATSELLFYGKTTFLGS